MIVFFLLPFCCLLIASWSARSLLALVLFTLVVLVSTVCDCCVKFVIICICCFSFDLSLLLFYFFLGERISRKRNMHIFRD
jgi:hypothetical protein